MRNGEEIANVKTGPTIPKFSEYRRPVLEEIYRRLFEIAAGGTIYPDDVRTKWVTVTKVEVGFGRTFWQDEYGNPLVPSGYVRADDALQCIDDLSKGHRELEAFYERQKKASDVTLETNAARIGELGASVESLLAQRKESELRYRRKLRAAKKAKPGPTKRVR